MQRQPRRRNERITDGAFLGTMLLAGLLTAGVTFVVYLHALQTGSEQQARTEAFAILVFTQLFLPFGFRSASKPVWRIPLQTNITLAVVVLVSFGLQVWSHHNAVLGRFLKTSFLSLGDCVLLLIVGAIPLLVLELVKLWRNGRNRVELEVNSGSGA
jgi:Ca2+-transporting ATPase